MEKIVKIQKPAGKRLKFKKFKGTKSLEIDGKTVKFEKNQEKSVRIKKKRKTR